MRLNVSKRFIKSGEILEITWNSEEATAPRLILKTGSRQSSMAVPESGSKRFRMKRTNGGGHCVALTANVYGKEKTIKKRIFVYGKAKDTDEFEYVDRGDASPLRRWNGSIDQWWKSFTPEKRTLYKLLLLLLTCNFTRSVPSLQPFSEVLFYIIIFWLFWQVVKK